MLAGGHGTGRLSLFRLMGEIHSFVLSRPDSSSGRVWDAFSFESCTGWQNRAVQTFEIEIEQDKEPYLYRLLVAHANKDEFQTRVVKEELHHGGQIVFSFADGEGRLQAADGSFTKLYQSKGDRSALAMLLSSTKDERLCGFSRLMDRYLLAGAHRNLRSQRSRWRINAAWNPILQLCSLDSLHDPDQSAAAGQPECGARDDPGWL